MEWIWLNGEMVPAQEATVSVMDHGFLYGVGLFETLRLYEGYPFLWRDHLERLQVGLRRLRITSPYQEEEWRQIIAKVSQQNKQADGVIRISVTGGAEGVGLSVSSYATPTTVVFMRPLPQTDASLYKEGKWLQPLSLPRQVPAGTESLKSHNYLNSVLARQEVHDFPQVEGLMLTKEGWLAEGIVSNLFFVKDETVYTPTTDLGILPGVTRHFVLTLAQKIGYSVEEGAYGLSNLADADEIFITNSVVEIVPIAGVEGIGEFPVGPVTMKLRQHYQQWTMRLQSTHCL
ncbi:aminotransferase class IV [Mechercharimyces sp. CAU 1602]|uniref:aminotransferase class IV n=1 Tax=Mechercharimyces sp. CAU 1602 TaxID=2973933 RepID=UPI0021625E20|nr:aminotransferase class IV [Mechercharimyces sp. CAU 1602]MCS1352401.1 aminotransferase class IV [Mechercharimyces sp. CAU 1602]